LRYGYDLPFSDNVVGDPLAHPPLVLDPVPPEEKKRRTAIRAKLRQVRGLTRLENSKLTVVL
jgi:hypothetical protein